MPKLEFLILEALRQRPQGLRRAELRRMTGATTGKGVRAFAETLRAMMQQGSVIKRGRGRLGLPDAADSLTGVVTVHARGFGFVSRDGDGPDIFIPPDKLGNAFAGDHVRVQITEETDKGPAGMVMEVLQRGHTHLTGEYAESGPTPVIRPLRRDFPEEIPLLPPRDMAAGEQPQDGDWVTAEILFPDSQRGTLRARLIRVLNEGASLTEDMDAIVAEFALPAPYSKEQQEEAAKLAIRPIARTDATDLPTITIDPVDAKDFDDAISLQATAQPGILRAGVHIADVAAYIVPGGDLDQEARRRGFTAYLPGRTLPMLPTPLAADLCSLKEGQIRPAHSVFLDIDEATGDIVAAHRCHSTIRVSKRLHFKEVQTFLETGGEPGWGEEMVALVRKLGQLARRLRDRRGRQEHFLDLATTEIRVLYSDDPPAITGFQENKPNPAHELVEEFMLAANVAVAGELIRKKIPGIFRTHSTPKREDMDEFRDWARTALQLKPGKLDSRESVNTFLHTVSGHRAEQLVFNAFLRTLPRAVYASEWSEHFGLGKEQYTHFTSPIRRYADLTVHQQLWAQDSGDPLLDDEECAARAKEATAIEAINDEAYFAALDRVKIRYVNQRRGEGEKVTFQALVSRATPDGLLLFIPELGLMGFCPKDLLGRDDYIYSAKAGTLKARHADRLYRCGDLLSVRPHRADVARGQLTLRPLA